MKTKYKYIEFILCKRLPKTKVYNCFPKGKDWAIGTIKWYPPWRQYCFFPEGDTVFNNTCQNDIAEFLTNLNLEHKNKK